jgi:hypothetical protein
MTHNKDLLDKAKRHPEKQNNPDRLMLRFPNKAAQWLLPFVLIRTAPIRPWVAYLLKIGKILSVAVSDTTSLDRWPCFHTYCRKSW